MPQIKACCFTGYRPEKFPFPFEENHLQYTAFEDKLTDSIFALASEGYSRFYTGAARGFDLLAAELVLLGRRLRGVSVELYCAVPFRGQDTGWSEAWRRRYARVLEQADHVEYLADGYCRGCYQRRNQFMVDHSQLVLTYYDGQAGGTAGTLAYARRQGKPIVNLADYEIEEEMEAFPYQFEIL